MAEIQDLPERLCDQCRGAGCEACHHIGFAVYLGGKWGVWRHPINAATIAARGIKRGADAAINLLLGGAGLAGIVALSFILLELSETADPLGGLIDLRGDWRLFGVSLALLAGAMLWYRVTSARDAVVMIRRGNADDAPASLANIHISEIASLPDDERVNLADALTPQAMRCIEQAYSLAHSFRAAQLAPAFLLAASLSYTSIRAIQARLGMSDGKFSALLQALLDAYSNPQHGAPVISTDFVHTMARAYLHAAGRRALQIHVTDIFAATILADQRVRELFDELEITPDTIQNVVAWITIQEDIKNQRQYLRSRARFKPKGTMNRAMTAIATPLLDRLSHDLTHLARAGVLAPCIAREREITEMFRLLQSGTNVMLVGNPGVGKTTIVEGLAQRMVTEDVPEVLQDKRLVSLSIAALVGANTGAGDVEQRLTHVLDEAVRAGNVVLFLDNIHNLIGVGSGGGATLDLSEILSAVVKDGRLHVVATTDPVNYRRYVETASGLSGAFTALNVEEVDTNAAIQIVEAKSGRVEYEQKVFFSYQAVEKIVTLAKRYIHDRYLPEKALAVMQEVAVFARKEHGPNSIVSDEDVAKVVAEKTNIAVTTVTQEERAKLLNLEDEIHKRIIGQHEAVQGVAGALRRARVELRDTSRPIASLLFLGPTGVGKTELAKTVAKVYFGAEETMVRLDMSEYQDSSSIYRLLGSPLATGRGTEGGYLSDAVRRNPFSLVLLDEFEKAHPDILNVFLQVMDDGRLTDSAGRTVDFTNTIIIATSNAGTEAIQAGMREGLSQAVIKERLINDELGRYFRPELINRFDQIIMFTPLAESEIVAIAKLLLQEVAERLLAKGITLEASEAAVRELAREGFDPVFGARPLRRVIQDKVDNALAKYLLTGTLGRRDHVVLEPGGVLRVIEAPSIWGKIDSTAKN